MKNPASLYDILTAWQAGEIGYRTALDMAQIDTLDELYDAANLSGVEIRNDLSPAEEAAADRLADLIRSQPVRAAA